VPIHEDKKEIYVMNATDNNEIFLKSSSNAEKYEFLIYDCKGKVVDQGEIELKQLMSFTVPKAGLLQLTRL